MRTRESETGRSAWRRSFYPSLLAERLSGSGHPGHSCKRSVCALVPCQQHYRLRGTFVCEGSPRRRWGGPLTKGQLLPSPQNLFADLRVWADRYYWQRASCCSVTVSICERRKQFIKHFTLPEELPVGRQCRLNAYELLNKRDALSAIASNTTRQNGCLRMLPMFADVPLLQHGSSVVPTLVPR